MQMYALIAYIKHGGVRKLTFPDRKPSGQNHGARESNICEKLTVNLKIRPSC